LSLQTKYQTTKAVVKTTILLPFDSNSTALRPFDVTAYLLWAAALWPK